MTCGLCLANAFPPNSLPSYPQQNCSPSRSLAHARKHSRVLRPACGQDRIYFYVSVRHPTAAVLESDRFAGYASNATCAIARARTHPLTSLSRPSESSLPYSFILSAKPAESGNGRFPCCEQSRRMGSFYVASKAGIQPWVSVQYIVQVPLNLCRQYIGFISVLSDWACSFRAAR